jgi:hypothetical protein
VAGRRGDDELLLPQQGGGKLVADRVRVHRGERAVDLVRAEHGEHLLLRVLDHVHGHARVLGAELREHAEQVVAAERPDAADPDRALEQPGQALELGVQVVDLGEHALGVGQHEPALLGHLHRTACAAEDLDAELGFEAADLL